MLASTHHNGQDTLVYHRLPYRMLACGQSDIPKANSHVLYHGSVCLQTNL